MKPEQEVRLLQIELAKAKQEATRLRKKLGENGRHARRIELAYEDALLLVSLRVGGVFPSRRLSMSLGLSQSRWEHAVALLKLARVITRRRTWLTTDPTVIEPKLTTAKQKALEDSQLFFLRHSRHRRRW
jgi:hypothetical protein